MVVFDNVRWNLTDPITAIELAFATFFALDLQYPDDSDQMWLFVQQGLFNIFLPGDGKRIGMSLKSFLCYLKK